MISSLSQADIDALAAEGRKDLAKERGESAQTKTANGLVARQITSDSAYHFRGKRLKVRPLPMDDGLKLMELAALTEEVRSRIESGGRVGPEVFEAYRITMGEIARIAHMLVRPRLIPRFLWRALPNRFRYATRDEMLDILRFCARCQMIFPGRSAAAGVQ